MTRLPCAILAAVGLALGASAWAAPPDPAEPETEKPAEAKPADAKSAEPADAKSAEAKPDRLSAVVKEVKGTVETRPAVGKPWAAVKVGTVLAEGADLRTGFRASCILEMVNSLVKIDPLTVIRIGQLTRKDDKVLTRLIMKHGNAEAVVEKERMESDFRIVTPSATLSVRGTNGAKAGFFLDKGGTFGLAGPGLVGIQDHYLGKQTLCQPGQNTNDQIVPPIRMLQKNFLPVILPLQGLGPQEQFAAGRWGTSNPMPGGLKGPLGPPNLLNKQLGQQQDPSDPSNPSDNGEDRGDITMPPGCGY